MSTPARTATGTRRPDGSRSVREATGRASAGRTSTGRPRTVDPQRIGPEDPDGPSRWVDAAPFRAHLAHLMAVGAMTSDMIAVLAGVSPALTQRLLTGRRGRAVRRISPLTAAKLFQVTPHLVRSARHRQVPAGSAGAGLLRLRAEGWSDPELADLLRLSTAALAELAALAAGRSPRCSQWVALRLAAEELRLDPWATQRSAASRAA